MRTKSFRQMSGVGLLLLTTVLSTKTLGQGVVWFDNRPAYLPSPPDRRVLLSDGSPIGGPAPGTNVSQFYAQLVYQDRTGTWIAHPTVARFFTSAQNAGFWNGGSRTLVNAGSPAAGVTESVLMQVRVWDGGIGTATQPLYSFDQALASGRPWGTSAVFVYTEEWDTPRGTDDTYMKNFVWVPEPSITALAAIGGAALLLGHRRSSLKRETMKPTSVRQLGSLSVLLLSALLSARSRSHPSSTNTAR